MIEPSCAISAVQSTQIAQSCAGTNRPTGMGSIVPLRGEPNSQLLRSVQAHQKRIINATVPGCERESHGAGKDGEILRSAQDDPITQFRYIAPAPKLRGGRRATATLRLRRPTGHRSRGRERR